MPPRTFPRSLAAPSLLAHIIMAKYGMGMPLFRIEDRFARDRCSIDRGTMCRSSGRWVDDNVLVPLGADRKEACITDCLDTYCSSGDRAGRIDDTYLTLAQTAELPVKLRVVRLVAYTS
jgi:transposase